MAKDDTVKFARVKHNWWRKSPVRIRPIFASDSIGYIHSGTVVEVKEQDGDYCRIEVWVNRNALEVLK